MITPITVHAAGGCGARKPYHLAELEQPRSPSLSATACVVCRAMIMLSVAASPRAASPATANDLADEIALFLKDPIAFVADEPARVAKAAKAAEQASRQPLTGQPTSAVQASSP